MQTVTIIRGSTGTVAWAYRRTGVDEFSWICLRDNFKIVTPATQAGIEAFLVAVAQHSATLVGTIAQVVQLDI